MTVESWVASCSAAFLLFVGYAANTPATNTSVDPAKAQITVLYDAFGQPSAMQKDWAMPLLSNMAANAFCSIQETIPTFSPRTPKQKTSTSQNLISSSCPTGTAITWGDWPFS